MEIKHKDNGGKGAFIADNNGAKAGEMTYVWVGENKFIIDHTEVDPEYGGMGVGKLMVLSAVEFARDNDVKILPLCPFAKSVFDKFPELRDVL